MLLGPAAARAASTLPPDPRGVRRLIGSQPDPSVWEGVSPIDFYTRAYVGLVLATSGILALPVHLAGYREQSVLRRFSASALARGPWPERTCWSR